MKPRKSLTRSLCLPEGLQVLREGNTILYPWFAMGKYWSKAMDKADGIVRSEYHDWRPGNMRYEIKSGNVTKTIDILGTSLYWVPTEFDYHVFLALLAIQAKNGKNPEFSFGIMDVINILGLTKGGRVYKDIADSIERLTYTTYKIDDAFVRKVNIQDEDMFSETGGQPRSGLNDDWMSDSVDPEAVEHSTEVDPSPVDPGCFNIRERKFYTIKLFDLEQGSIKERSDNGQILKASYTIRFSRFIMKGISERYFRFFDANKLLGLKSWPLKRFYEIIEFKANTKDGKWGSVNFLYDELASMIPLNSGRMNKTYIIKYAEELLSKEYIAGFDTETDKKAIRIQLISRSGEESWAESGPASDAASGDEIESANLLKIRIREILNKKKMAEISEEVYKIMSNPDVNKKGLDTEGLLSNLEYAVKNAKPWSEGPFGYIRRAIENDWASATKKKAAKKPSADGEGGSNPKPDQSADKAKKKEIFSKYVENMPAEDLERLFAKYKIPAFASKNAKMESLRASLFSDWTLSV